MNLDINHTYFVIRQNINEVKTIIISIEYNVIYNYICKLTPSLIQKVLIELNQINYLCTSLMTNILYNNKIIYESNYMNNFIKLLIYNIEQFAYKVENDYYKCTCCIVAPAMFEQFEDIIYILEKCIIL